MKTDISFLLSLLILLAIPRNAFSQDLINVTGGNLNNLPTNATYWTLQTGGAAPITGVTYIPSDTTIVATWNTSSAANSTMACGGKNGADNGLAPNSTSHQAIVTGLSPDTGYSCTVTSNSTSSLPQTVTTNAAQTRLPINQVALGSAVTRGTQQGDTFLTFVSNDGNQYISQDDGYGLQASPNAGANMQWAILNNLTTLVGTNVNLLTAYGGFATTNGTDGPGGIPQTNKVIGVFGLGGSLFQFQHRQSSVSGFIYLIDGNIMGSTDHGATWNSWQNPSVYSAKGIPPSPIGSYQFATGNIGAVLPIRYAADDGTIGYLTRGNRIDGADGWVYMAYNLQGDTNNLFLMRCLRYDLLNDNCTRSGSIAYWSGPASSSMTPAAFVSDSNWQSGIGSATACFTDSINSVQTAEVDFIPGLNRYLLINLQRSDIASNSGTSFAQYYDGVTPCGSWTLTATNADLANAWYYPSVAHSTMVGNTSTSAIPLALLYSGTNATYGMFTSSAILNPTSLPNMQQLISLTPSATENPLSDGGNVSTVTNWQNVQTVSSGVFEGMSTTAFNMAAYTGPPVVGDTGAPWPADQCADVTISSVNGSGYITPLVRMNASTGAGYLLSVGPSGSGYTQILKANAGGTRPALTGSVAVTVSNSDIWRICSVGTSISEYQQPAGTVGFNLIQSVSDLSYAGGDPGIGMQGTSVVTDARIGLWAAEANQALSPTFSTYTHGYSASVTVTSATSGATIYYTTNGTQPTRSSSTISNGGTVTVSSPETLKAMAAYTDLADSPPSTVSY